MTETMIRTEGLWKEYDGKPILRDINIEIAKGSMVLIEGRSGTGKTTLLNILGCMDTSTRGHLWIDGKEVTKMGHKRLSKLRLHNIGFIFQEHNLIGNLTVEENIILPMKIAKHQKGHARLEELLEAFDIVDIRDKKPAKISGGEAQRAAISRALANEPDILLADEPTASLDLDNAGVVLGAFKKANEIYGSTVVVTSHDSFVKSYFSIRHTISEGKLSSEWS
ncbi:MAG: ABC transporter ATP-binding protein [Thermoplasmata archaeon]|nr:ABC transporter ATP-binding protein [Thermoplasmata archaeon]